MTHAFVGHYEKERGEVVEWGLASDARDQFAFIRVDNTGLLLKGCSSCQAEAVLFDDVAVRVASTDIVVVTPV